MLVIKDEKIRFLVLSHLIEAAECDRDAVLANSGLKAAHLESLRQVSSKDLLLIAQLPEPEMTIHLDALRFEHALGLLDYLNDRAALLEYFVQHGATSSMLTALFKISPHDVVLKRALLKGKPGRPHMPDATCREAIQLHWHKMHKSKSNNPPSAEDYHALHQEFSNLSLATLYAVVHEFS